MIKWNKGDHIISPHGEATVITDDGQYVVYTMDGGRITSSPKHACVLLPSPDEIAGMTETIQSKWTKRQEWNHTAPSDRSYPVEIQGGEIHGFAVTANEDRLRFLSDESEDENG